MNSGVDRFTFGSHEHNDYLNRKLAHYNEWLLNPNRKSIDGPYPGFPDDLERVRAVSMLQKEHVEKVEKKAATKAAKKPATKSKRAKRENGQPTKQDRAIEIFKRLSGAKLDVIAAIQGELGMTPAGATTYYYNAKKAVHE